MIFGVGVVEIFLIIVGYYFERGSFLLLINFFMFVWYVVKLVERKGKRFGVVGRGSLKNRGRKGLVVFLEVGGEGRGG